VEDLRVRPLKHGYTNRTVGDATSVIKTYQGPDAMLRREREQSALRHLRGRMPVPEIYASEPGSLTLEFLPGTHGQDLIEQGYATQVLRACGEQLRALHALPVAGFEFTGAADADADAAQQSDSAVADSSQENASTANSSQTSTSDADRSQKNASVVDLAWTSTSTLADHVLVHGDFGPQNTLLDPATFAVTALLDWEFAHMGSPVADLAWCEWIIRAHHPAHRDALAEFFTGYGGPVPTWSERQAAMVARCDALRRFCHRWNPDGPGERQWIERHAAASAWWE
jgi:aminoglycoside phosphotransferase (APT) family kinase protein